MNIADMVAIQQHIAIVNQLNSPFKLIAADVFRNNKINIQDLVATQRMVAIVDTVFSNNTSWQFVDKSHVFSNPANPWLQPYPESRIISGLSGNISNADFTGVKIGDVNLSNNPTGISGMWNDDRNFESLLIKIPERVQVIDGYVRIPILVGNDFDLQGIQFSLVFDRESLSIEAINPSEVMDEFNETNINLKWSDDGLAVLAWAAPGGIGRSLVAGQKLFELIMKAGKKAPEWISLGDKLRLGEEFTESMAVGNRLNEYNLKLETTSTVKDKEDSFRFAPNPFNNSTNLYMNLANSTVVRLKLLDSDGKVLFDESKWVEEGSQTWHLSDHNLSVSRVIFYQIQTDSNVISGRLLKLN